MLERDDRPDERLEIVSQFANVREQTEALIKPLSEADCQLQSMDDVSPAKWHLAHTSWYFETFVLAKFVPGYTPFDARFSYLFNSYYNAVGKQFPRPKRGQISRPNLATVLDYREHVDRCIQQLFSAGGLSNEANELLILGIHHEQQHQELLLMDIKHAFFQKPHISGVSGVNSNAGGGQPGR